MCMCVYVYVCVCVLMCAFRRFLGLYNQGSGFPTLLKDFYPLPWLLKNKGVARNSTCSVGFLPYYCLLCCLTRLGRNFALGKDVALTCEGCFFVCLFVCLFCFSPAFYNVLKRTLSIISSRMHERNSWSFTKYKWVSGTSIDESRNIRQRAALVVIFPCSIYTGRN